MSGHSVMHHFSTGQYIKEVHLAAGLMIAKHTHPFSHFSILVKGSALLTVDGAQQVLEAPAIVTVEADAAHTVQALTDIVWLCTHSLEEEFDTDPAKIDAILIAKGK